MRALVIALAILAGTKIWAHQELYRAASEQALLKAYTQQAVLACKRNSRLSLAQLADGGRVTDWSQYDLAQVVMGNKSLNVSLWQVDHEHWDQRYKTPFIHLNVGGGSHRHVCIYNVMTGTTALSRA